MLQTITEIEDAMADIIEASVYPFVLKEYHRMLEIMGNVDGDEIVALVLAAAHSNDNKGVANPPQLQK